MQGRKTSSPVSNNPSGAQHARLEFISCQEPLTTSNV